MSNNFVNGFRSIIKTVSSQLLLSSLGIRGDADIVLSVNGYADRIVFPVVSADLPQIDSPQHNETFTGVLADIAVIGTMGLRSVHLEGLLPAYPSKYPFCRPLGDDASTVINFIKKYQDEYVPMTLNITFSNGDVYVNMDCLTNNFTYSRDQVGDYHFTLDLMEYRTVKEGNLL